MGDSYTDVKHWMHEADVKRRKKFKNEAKAFKAGFIEAFEMLTHSLPFRAEPWKENLQDRIDAYLRSLER